MATHSQESMQNLFSRPYAGQYLLAKVRINKRGPKVVSTFSGCGGSTLGYTLAGCKVLMGLEFAKPAAECYAKNFQTPMLVRDIRTVGGSEILKKIGLKRGELDILDGSPPCSAFSMIGKREAGWGEFKEYSEGMKQRVDDLFNEYIRLISEINPRVFVAENVKGLISGKSKGKFIEFIELMRKLGYDIHAAVLDAGKYGVAQHRERLFIVGLRSKDKMKFEFPAPTTSVQMPIRDVLPGYRGIFFNWRKSTASKVNLTFVSKCPTITAQGLADLWHRYLTIQRDDLTEERVDHRHLKRLASLPDDFVLTGNANQQWERVGRCVPPLLMKELALNVRNALDS